VQERSVPEGVVTGGKNGVSIVVWVTGVIGAVTVPGIMGEVMVPRVMA